MTEEIRDMISGAHFIYVFNETCPGEAIGCYEAGLPRPVQPSAIRTQSGRFFHPTSDQLDEIKSDVQFSPTYLQFYHDQRNTTTLTLCKDEAIRWEEATYSTQQLTSAKVSMRFLKQGVLGVMACWIHYHRYALLDLSITLGDGSQEERESNKRDGRILLLELLSLVTGMQLTSANFMYVRFKRHCTKGKAFHPSD